nr:DUF3857 domain-containing protein [uncultured Psychroserpens sp.]
MKQLLILFLLIPFISISQDFSDEDYIYLKRHEHIKIKLKKHKFDIIQNVSEQAKFMTSNILNYANEHIGYSSFSEIKDIEAYTFIPNTKKKIEVDYFETKQFFDGMVFYDDTEYTFFTFPAVKKGAVTNLNYTRIVKEPYFLGGFNFVVGNTPTKSAQLSIEFPKNVTIGYTEFNTDLIDLDFKKEENKDNYIYTWTATNTYGYKSEEDSEAPMYYLPHIKLRIKSYTENGKEHRVLGNLSDLYKWYNDAFIENIEEGPLDQVKSLAEDITKMSTTKAEKAEAIFNWVQDNINYIAFGDGYNGLIPTGAASTCESRYGDCKAMTNLIYQMLNHVGIKAYRTWIGSRNKPYKYSELPTGTVADHMILTAIIDGEKVFLDATDNFIPYGVPTAFIQGKEALIGISYEDYEIVQIPAPNAEQNTTTITTLMELEGDRVKVFEKRALTGYEKVEFVTDYTYKKDTKTEEEYLNTTLSLGNNKTKYNNITKANFDNKNTPLTLEYDLDIDSYTKSIGDKIYINLNIDRALSKSDIDIKGRKYSKKIDYKFQKTYNTIFKIPDGYKASYIPKETLFEDSNYGYKISYSVKDNNSIIQTKSIYVNTLSIQNDEFDQWNNFIKSLIKSYKKSIILEQQHD